MFDLIIDPNSLPGIEKRVWAGRVTLSAGAYTIDHSADLEGVARIPGNELDNAPVVTATPHADDAIAKTTSTYESTVLDDGSGSSTSEVDVVIAEQ